MYIHGATNQPLAPESCTAPRVACLSRCANICWTSPYGLGVPDAVRQCRKTSCFWPFLGMRCSQKHGKTGQFGNVTSKNQKGHGGLPSGKLLQSVASLLKINMFTGKILFYFDWEKCSRALRRSHCLQSLQELSTNLATGKRSDNSWHKRSILW